MRVVAVLATITLLAGAQVPTKTPALLPTPPMGWNSWNHFATKVTEQDVMGAADALVSSGMRDAGYIYVNVDDTWEGERDGNGVLHSNSKFPDMKALGDYIHARGLKFGIYSSPGPLTCGKFAGSFGHEQQDADLYASWGVDYLRYDLCSFRGMMQDAGKKYPADQDLPNRAMREAYTKMRQALNHTGRPIAFSLCQYGWNNVWEWAPGIGGNLWRTTGDIHDNWPKMSAIGFGQAGLAKYAGPGHWNDPDMLEVGNGGMTPDEYRTHMSLWALLAAPLIAGNDLTQMNDDTKAILMNKAVIAIDQDPLGKQGDRLRSAGPLEIWTKTLSGGAVAVGLFNRGEDTEPITFTAAEVGLPNVHSASNLWTGQQITAVNGAYTFTIPKHAVVLLRLQP